jgi:hypothetical protein
MSRLRTAGTQRTLVHIPDTERRRLGAERSLVQIQSPRFLPANRGVFGESRAADAGPSRSRLGSSPGARPPVEFGREPIRVPNLQATPWRVREQHRARLELELSWSTAVASWAPRSKPRSGELINRRGVLDELNKLDMAVYTAIARTPTPSLDQALGRLSRSADFSKLWLGSASALAVFGGDQGRRAALNGIASLALTSALVNAVLKPLWGRRRPERVEHRLPFARRVRMPRSRSFPSGHAASGFAFATGVASEAPVPGGLLAALAALVAYSRVHTGVHYPSDVVAGAVIGVALSRVAVAATERYRASGP